MTVRLRVTRETHADRDRLATFTTPRIFLRPYLTRIDRLLRVEQQSLFLLSLNFFDAFVLLHDQRYLLITDIRALSDVKGSIICFKNDILL